MAEASIDQLRITIESKADSARGAVTGLADDVKKLKNSTKGVGSALTGVANGLDRLSNANVDRENLAAVADAVRMLSGIKISSTVAKNVGAIADATGKMTDSASVRETFNSIRSMSGVKLSSSIANQINKIINAAGRMSQVKLSTSKFDALYGSLSKLSSLPKSNLGSTLNALKKLPELSQSLKTVNLESFRKACDAINESLGKLPEKFASVAAGFRSIKAAAKGFGSAASSSMKSAGNNTGSLVQKLTQTAYAIRNVSVVASMFYKVAQAIGYCVDQSNKYIENINLADTSLGQYADRAHEYANAVQSALGINAGEFLSNQGTFMTMAKGMGVAADNAYTMSKGLTQLSYDLASFFNISNDEAFEKVKSGLAGEIEPLRALGYDLTTARLQQEAYNMGINENVSNMTQAEKAMLRYRAIMSQVSWAQGDLAKTAASPANQIRILKSQLQTAAQAIGNAFLPMLQAIIPIAVAVVKVIATLANLLAKVTGGTAIANMSFGDGGELENTAGAADDAADSLGDAGDAASGTGDKAGKAAKQVAELKRQLMGFDEINKFSDTSSSDGSSGSGSGGSGGGGGGAGSPGISDIKLSDYDWNLGDGFGDELYDQIMSLLKRIGKAFEPLVNDFKVLAQAIKHQFEGLDIAGAIKNSIAAAANLISNAVRQIIEILGPLVVAFNFPETIALAFDLCAQMCLTLSAAINGVGSMVKGFTDTALVQFVAWVGDKVRGAILVCIGVLQSWQEWFINNTTALSGLGQAAGIGASIVLHLAEAVADVAFATASTVIQGLNTAFQTLLGILVNSAPARVAVTLLGAALTAMAITNGISKAIQTVGNVFEQMAYKLTEKSKDSADHVNILSSNLKGQLTKAAGNAKSAIEMLGEALGITKGKTGGARAACEQYKSSVKSASDALDAERAKLEIAKESLGENAKWTERLGIKAQELRVKTAESNLALEQSKDKLNSAKLAAIDYATSQDKTVTGAGRVAAAELKASAEVTASATKYAASKTAMTVAEGALTVAKGVGTVAQNLLNAAVSAFPGMLFMSALSGILSLLQPIVDGIGNFVAGLLGLNDTTGDVTDSTKEANEVLSEEEQQVKNNVDSIKEYEKSHDNLKDALAMAGFSEKEFAQHLADTGQSFDDLSQKQDSFVNSTINSFNQLDTSQSMTFDQLAQNMHANLDTQRNWSQNMQELMRLTGLGANDSLIQGLLSAGPEKVGNAVQEALNDPTGQKLEELKSLAGQLGTEIDPELGAAIASGGGAQTKQSASDLAKGATDGVKGEKENTKSEAKKTSEETASEFKSAKGQAQTSGTEMVSAYAKGINDGRTTAINNAKSCMQSVVDALNGGTGYNKALSAGKNLIGGYGDGIKNGTNAVVTKAKSAMTSVVNALNGGTGYNKAHSAGANLMGGYKDGLSGAVNSAVAVAQSACNRVVNALRSGQGSASSSGSSVMGSFRNGLSGASGSAISTARSTSNSAGSAFASGSSKAHSAGRSLGNNFVNGLKSVNARGAGESVANSGEKGLRSYRQWYENAGRYCGYGFDDGLWSTRWTIYNTAEVIANNAVRRMERALGIASPSKVTKRIGRFFGQGFAIGIQNSDSTVADAVKDMTAESLDATTEAAKFGKQVGKAYGSAIGDGIDVSKVAGMLQYSENMARSTSAATFDGASNRYTSHESFGGSLETDAAAEAISRAVIQSVMTVGTPGSQQANVGDTTIVLRVGNEDLARAVVKGNESLARRGVVSLE